MVNKCGENLMVNKCGENLMVNKSTNTFEKDDPSTHLWTNYCCF